MKKIHLLFILFTVFQFSIQAQGPTDLWGVTFRGGAGLGTLFKIDNNTNTHSVVYSFDSKFSLRYGTARFREAGNHMLYTVMKGGPYDEGVVVELDPSTGKVKEKAYFNSITSGGGGLVNNMVLGSNGKFYGTMSNDNIQGRPCYIFEYDVASNTLLKKAAFNDSFISSTMYLAKNGKLYGVTDAGGNFGKGFLFEYDIASDIIAKKSDFGNHVKGKASMNMVEYHNKLYGCTLIRNDSIFEGSIYEYDIEKNVLGAKYNIQNMICPGQLAVGDDGFIYGSTVTPFDSLPGVFFKFDPITSKFTSIQNFDFHTTGGDPYGGVTKCKNGVIYGALQYGGMYLEGSIYEYVPATSKFKIVYNFKDTLSGYRCISSFEQAQNGKLYCCTFEGGRFNVGVIFEFDIAFGKYKKLQDLGDGLNGDNPNGSLSLANNGKIYAVASSGGLHSKGVLLECDPSTEPPTLKKKIDFHVPTSGMNPASAPVQGPNGKFYGTTPGDQYNVKDPGTLYEYDPVTNKIIVKVRFNDSNGTRPGELLLASNNKFYGVTYNRGKYCKPVLFEFDPATGKYTKRFDFSEGRMAGRLLQAKNGRLYGILENEFSAKGALFEYTLTSDTIIVKARFDHSVSSGSLVEAEEGRLFGIGTPNEQNEYFLFEYNLNTQLFKKLYTFSDTANGIMPVGSLLVASNGNLYGMTSWGGSDHRGVVYEYNYRESVYSKKIDFKGPNGMRPFFNNNLIEVCKSIPYQGAPATVSVCEATDLILSTGADKNKHTFQWYKNNQPFGSATSDTLNVQAVKQDDAGIYFCKISNGCRTIQTAETAVKVLSPADPDCGVGIEEQEKIAFEIYPNPAADEFQIRFDHPTHNRITIELIDVLGKSVVRENIILSEQSATLTINHLKSGIYIVRALDANIMFENRKLIKY